VANTHYHWEIAPGRILVLDTQDYDRFKDRTIHFDSDGYAYYIDAGAPAFKRALHREILGNPANLFVDHRDGNRLNLTRENLRVATVGQNNKNRSGWSKHGVKGTEQHKSRWKARIISDGIRYNIGRFKTKFEAAVAHDLWAEVLNGEFARLNYSTDDTEVRNAKEKILSNPEVQYKYEKLPRNQMQKMEYDLADTSTGVMPFSSVHSTQNPEIPEKSLATNENPVLLWGMLDSINEAASDHPLRHIFHQESAQTVKSSVSSGIDTHLYTQLTDQLLNTFYPKYCCGQPLIKTDGKRELMLRCPTCHRQESRLVGTPLHHLKIPRWTFSYILREMVIQHPNVMTSAQIERRLSVAPETALTLKRRIQLFASEQLPTMQKKFYEVLAHAFQGFNLPADKDADLTEFSKQVPVPQADTVVLYSCSQRANKGRKRWKRKGQTSSIYMSESLGGHQKGTLVNTLAIRGGPAFFTSISDQKASTINPIITRYMPHTTPLFTDMGYRGFSGRNLRMVNHSARSKDARHKYARDRYCKNGVHCNVAEGSQGVLKQSFAGYRWIKPKYSQLYLNEYAFIRNLRHFDLEVLASGVGQGRGQGFAPEPAAGFAGIPGGYDARKKSAKIQHQICAHEFSAKSLLEIKAEETRMTRKQTFTLIDSEPDPLLRSKLRRLQVERARWQENKPTKDQRRKQREFEALAAKAWPELPSDGYIEFRELADRLKISTRNLFRIIPIWLKHGLIEVKDLNRPTKSKHAKSYDLKRKAAILIPILYALPKQKAHSFTRKWTQKIGGKT
jgi:hypothetical protein